MLKLTNRALSWSAVAAIALLLGGCGKGETLGKRIVAPPRFGDPASIVTHVSVTPTEFHAGESVQVEVSVRNPTTLPIMLYFNSGCTIEFAVKDLFDAVVAPTGYACTANVPTVELPAGQTITQRFSWDGRAMVGYGPYLPAGEYRVIGGLDPSAVRYPSAPVTVTFHAP